MTAIPTSSPLEASFQTPDAQVPPPGTAPGQGALTLSGSLFNAVQFLVRMMVGNLATATIVKVQNVNAPTGIAANYGTVDVLPLVNQVDSQGQPTPHEIVYGLPYVRIQGGTNAVVLDPQVGDLGIAVFASRDISAVKNTRAQSNPNSKRRYDMADGLYIGGVLNGEPTCYVAFVNGGIALSPDAGKTTLTVTPGLIVMSADEIVTLANKKNIWGTTNGAGFEYQPNQIDTYTTGVPSNAHTPPVPGS